MELRAYEFIVGAETGTQPDPGTPTDQYDLIYLSYAQSNFTAAPQVTGTKGAPSSIVAGTGVSFAGTSGQYFHIWFVQGSGGAVDVSASSQIADGTATGQKLLLIGCSETNTVTMNDGRNLKLNGVVVLGLNSTIELMWDGSDWIELSRNMM